NAIKHGNQLCPEKCVHISYHVACERCDIQIEDEGNGFDPAELPDPTDPENLERPCGRGVFMMRHFMTHVEHNARGNAVRMLKLRELD
ncbi:MAG: ATP-binding protein, partial [Gemmataceae bacterium]